MKGLLSVCVCAATAFALSGFAETREVPADQVPAVVWKTIQTATAGIKPGKIERVDEDGEVTFEATFTSKNGGERALSVGQDGQLLSLEVTLADLAAPVKETITEQVGEGKVDGINKAFEPDGATYEVDFTTKAGAERSFSVAEDGTLLSREVSLDELPAEVQKTIKARVGGGKLTSIDQEFDAGESTYEVEYTTKEGKEVTCSVSSNGRQVSMEVSLEETPAPVQATIKEKIGAGKVSGITKVLGPKKGAVHFEVEAIVDGKPLDFVVGVKGKLSEDEK
jgi:uncharacterized membrane protein YkoI